MKKLEAMTTDQSVGTEQLYFLPYHANVQALEWCNRNPAWVRICDLADTAQYYVQWDELTPAEQDDWGDADAYNAIAVKRRKIDMGFISGKGDFYSNALDVPFGHNLMMVLCIGLEAAKELRERLGGAWPVPEFFPLPKPKHERMAQTA